MLEYPLIRPLPARLSEMAGALRAIEDSGVYSNGGPVVRRFEKNVTKRLFNGLGDSLATANATLGLMLALKHAAVQSGKREGLVFMPALTFAATAQAADWAGLTPLICDIDPDDWTASAEAEEALLRRFGHRVVAMLPCATFGAAIELERYRALSEAYGVAIIVDAAASLGTIDGEGANFGASAPFAVVYSMHATKTFAAAEGGVVHSADSSLIDTLRRMSNFGFGAERCADLPGLNAKLPEVLGLLAQAKLDEIDAVCAHRAALGDEYRRQLSDICTAQRRTAARQALQFWPALLPPDMTAKRGALVTELAASGVGAGHYFSPHLGEQRYFQDAAIIGRTPVADDVSARMISLPVTDAMTVEDVEIVCDRLRAAIRTVCSLRPKPRVGRGANKIVSTVVIGGGPAGTAFLTAATKQNKLVALVQEGLTIVERGADLGEGLLGGYAIRSDSTAETFLSAVKDNIHPEIGSLIDHPAGRLMERSIGALGAPLVEAGLLLSATGTRLKSIVEHNGGTVLTRHEAKFAQRVPGGLWRTTVRDANGAVRELLSRHIVLATGGHQCPERLRSTHVAGVPLGELAGDRLISSDDFLKRGGLEAARARIAVVAAPRIAIVGGSTSALAAAQLLLKADPPIALGAGAVTVLHRRPLRPFYHSREAALADGFDDFTDDDVCPVSGFVYRLAGFRLEARDLVLRMLSIGGRVPDPRVALHPIAGDGDQAARAIIEAAGVVIGATGYRPHAFPLRGANGSQIHLACEAPEGAPMVDRHCRVLDVRGRPVPGAYGIGLAAGFRPWGPLGGEPSFRGQANGLWLWQNDVGGLIVDALLKEAERDVA